MLVEPILANKRLRASHTWRSQKVERSHAFMPMFIWLIRWDQDGAEAKAFLSEYRERKGWGTDWSACLNGYSHYFRPGLTWPRRTQSGLGLRVMPKGCIFADKGPAAIRSKVTRRTTCSRCLRSPASSAFRYLVELQMAFGSYEVGVIQRTPVP